ncbi:MAG: hypothetical protein WAN81_06645, partial [Candidatus Binataceae bacterium]
TRVAYRHDFSLRDFSLGDSRLLLIFHPIPRKTRPASAPEQRSVQGGYQSGERAKTKTSGLEVAIAIGRRKVGDENPYLCADECKEWRKTRGRWTVSEAPFMRA